MKKTKACIAHQEKIHRLRRLADYAVRDMVKARNEGRIADMERHHAESLALENEALELESQEPEPVPRAPRTRRELRSPAANPCEEMV